MTDLDRELGLDLIGLLTFFTLPLRQFQWFHVDRRRHGAILKAN